MSNWLLCIIASVHVLYESSLARLAEPLTAPCLSLHVRERDTWKEHAGLAFCQAVGHTELLLAAKLRECKADFPVKFWTQSWSRCRVWTTWVPGTPGDTVSAFGLHLGVSLPEVNLACSGYISEAFADNIGSLTIATCNLLVSLGVTGLRVTTAQGTCLQVGGHVLLRLVRFV